MSERERGGSRYKQATEGRRGEKRTRRPTRRIDKTRNETKAKKPDKTMRASGRSEQAGKTMRRDALRDERRNEERDDHRRRRTRTNSGRQLILSRAVLISSSLIIRRPAYRPGSSVPFSSPFHRRPSSSIASSGLSVPRLVPLVVPVRFVPSGRPVVRFACRFSIILPLRLVPFMAADWQRRAGNGDGGEVFYAPFSPAHYRSSCHQVLLVGGGRRLIVPVPRRGGLDGFLIISSGSSHSPHHPASS